MSFLSGYQTKKAIAKLLDSRTSQPENRLAMLKIKKIGVSAIPSLLDALEHTKNPQVIETLLLSFLNNRTLPLYIEALSSDINAVSESVTRVLANSKDYDCSILLEQLNNTNVSKKAIGEILLKHHEQLNTNSLLALLDTVSSNVRPIVYKILDKVVSEKSVDSIVRKSESKEPMVRAHMATLLSRFNLPASVQALIKLLQDGNKNVRQSALRSLSVLKATESVQPVCKLLKDPDLMVQSVAIDCLVKMRDASTVKHLIDVLQDESEYVRRAAVEVLNEVGDERAIKDLLNALRDADWWVKVRAADALGSIGGPKVIDAVLVLIKDDDEFMRRTAVEILNTSKDERAFEHLVEALQDNDWWVRERAADALASMGDKRAVEPLIAVLKSNPDSSQVIVKALATLGDKRAIKPLIDHLNKKSDESQLETLHALEEITDADHSQSVQTAITHFIRNATNIDKETAHQTLQTLAVNFGQQTPDMHASTTLDSSMQNKSLNIDFKTESERKIIDASKFAVGDVFANRYKIIRQVGKGAFGVVVLVEDTMVADEFILKFLHPHFAADYEMIKRFTQELRYARKITHENIIRIYDLVNHDANYAISMEYFPSRSLASKLKSENKFTHRQALSVIEQICSGLRAAQQVNVVHRDLKPSNILINKHGIVKIVDFGLAAAATRADSRLTKTGVLVGTPTYMSPEQIKSKTIDSRTDIYALGVIMYEIFTGTAPYKGEGSLAVMYQHVEGNAKKPREHNAEIPEQIENIILKAMAVNPQERYQTFEDLQTDIRIAIGGIS